MNEPLPMPKRPADDTGNRAYDQLPKGVKDEHPYEGWLWLSDAEKARLVQSETEPDY